MDVKRVIEEKKNLEMLALDLLSEFEKLTGVMVSDLTIRRAHTIGGSDPICSVDTTCEIQ